MSNIVNVKLVKYCIESSCTFKQACDSLCKKITKQYHSEKGKTVRFYKPKNP